jgi:UDP-N-acetylmuramoylalanine--D-glutamate ligase
MPEKFDIAAYAGKTACVLGCGKSGVEVARMLAEHGVKVLLSEEKKQSQLKYKLSFEHPLIEAEFGGHSERIFSCAFAVKSPGMFPRAHVLEMLHQKKVPVYSEMEIALSFLPECEVFAVTGTNGKTTTTTLLGDILAEHMRLKGAGKAYVTGNIGTPLSAVIKQVKPDDAIAIEVSSYQLEDSNYFSPDSACLLNITPDHLDHHGGMEKYIAAKKKVFAQQKKDALCVFNALDEHCRTLAVQCPSKVLYFASAAGDKLPALDAYFSDGKINFRLDSGTVSLTPPALPGLHNIENAMAAGLMALGRGISPQAVQNAFTAFRAVEHRIEDCGIINGVRCINDSKATNVDSTLVALKALASDKKNIWLILGGLGKGAPYAPLAPYIKTGVKYILSIGADAVVIEEELKDCAPVVNCDIVDEALAYCLSHAAGGDILLFSPACASFDQFRDFEDRGRYFKKLVAEKLAVAK